MEICESEGQLEPWSRLDGKIVMVTGASSGIGLEFCVDLAKAGCRIVAAARRMDRLKSLCEQINQMNVPKDEGNSNGDLNRAVAVELDLTSDGQAIERSVEQAWDAFGHIDALINNAGFRGQVKSSLELSEEEWNKVMKTNLTGSWLVAKCVGTRMRNAGRGGSIINISSASGLNRTVFRGSIAYSSSKAGLDYMTKMMALELGDYKIRVNSIAPGLFKSEITEQLFKEEWIEKVAKVAARTLPLQTIATTDPGLTRLVRYLLHRSSGYVTGNVFIVDSGYTLPGVPIYSSL